MFALLHDWQSLWVEDYSKWTPATNDWKPNTNPGDNWIGPNNPFGPVIPVGAHGFGNTAPPAVIGDGWNGNSGGWSSGLCNVQGIGKCGQGPELAVDPRIMSGYGVDPLKIGNLQDPGLCYVSAGHPCAKGTVIPRMDYTSAAN